MDEEEKNSKNQLYFNKQYQNNLKLFNDLLKSQRIISSSFKQQIRQLNKVIKRVNKIAPNPSIKLAKSLSSIKFAPQFNTANIVKLNTDILSKFIVQQQKIYRDFNNNIASLGLAHAELASIAKLPQINVNHLNEIYENELALEEIANESEGNILEIIFQFFSDKINSLPKGIISAQGVLNLYMAVLTTIAFLLTYSQSQTTQQATNDLSSIKQNQIKTNELLENLNREVMPLINDLAKEDPEELIYIVTKDSPIRAYPSGKSDTLYRVYPNQPVKVINEQKRWFYVEYFDYKKSIPKLGYIYKGNVEEYKPE